jgi:hypothetical protein
LCCVTKGKGALPSINQMQSKLKHIAVIINCFVLSVLYSACGYGDRAHPVSLKKQQEGYEKAIVKDYRVDGCTWLLVLEDGKKLQPVELKPEFQKDNLRVWIRYEIKKNGTGICMTGEMVTITTIERRRKND